GRPHVDPRARHGGGTGGDVTAIGPLLIIALLVAAAAGVLTLRPDRPPLGRPLGARAATGRPLGRPDPARTVDPAVVNDLLAVAIGSGASIPRALEVVGDAVGGYEGNRLATAARSLRLGSPWSTAWR